MDPVTLAVLSAAVGGASGAAGPLLGRLGGQTARTAQRRELRELFNLRAALGEEFLDPAEYNRDIGVLFKQAQTQPFGPNELRAFDREIEGAQAGEALAGERAVGQNLAALGVGPGVAGPIEAEMERTRRIVANMARANIGSYAAQANVQQLEQSRQALSSALTDRYGTLATILAAGV